MPDSKPKLFRAEPLEFQRHQLKGEVAFVQSISWSFLTSFIALALSTLLIIAIFIPYPRVEVAFGAIETLDPPVILYSPDFGVLSSVTVQVGQQLSVGDSVGTFAIDVDRGSSTGRKHTTIRVTTAGQVQQILVGPGENLNVGQPILVTARMDRLRAKLFATRTAARSLTIGQTLPVDFGMTSDGASFSVTGQVSKIGSRPVRVEQSDQALYMFPIFISIDADRDDAASSLPSLYPTLRVQARIPVEKRPLITLLSRGNASN